MFNIKTLHVDLNYVDLIYCIDLPYECSTSHLKFHFKIFYLLGEDLNTPLHGNLLGTQTLLPSECTIPV